LATSSTAGALSASDKDAIDSLGTTYAAISHTHTLSNVTDAGTAAGYDVGSGSGQIPVLDGSGKISSGILPALAITNRFTVSSEAAMEALSSAETGDIAIRTDVNKTFILDGSYDDAANWHELLTPTDSVQSVNGYTGVVSLDTSDISEGTNLYWTNTRFDSRISTTPISDLATGDGDIALGGNLVTGLGAPSGANDAARKAYVDDQISGLSTTYAALSGGNTISGNQAVTGTVSATSFSGDGASVTNVDALTLNGATNSDFAAASHTHTASQVTDFNTAVRTNRLDQLAAPTSSVSLNSQKITGLDEPSNSADAATKSYVDTSIANFGTTYTGYVPDGSTTATINHNPGTSDISWTVYRISDGADVEIGGKRATSGGTPSDDHLTLTFTTAPTNQEFRVVIIAA
jgi:hypothetical protein